MISIISPYAKGAAPSERFRIENYLADAGSLKGSVRFYHFLGDIDANKSLASTPILKIGWILLKSTFRRFRHLFKLADSELILIHREAVPLGPPIFEWILIAVLRKRIIYDFDDAIWLPEKESEVWIRALIKCRWKFRFIIKHAYKVVAGNKYLLEYAKKYNPNSIIIPTVVNTEIHKRQSCKTTKNIVIGWTGSSSTMKYLDPVYAIIEKICARKGCYFKIISDKEPNYKSSFFKFVPWKRETEIEDLQDIDIGIMPLTDDAWSKGKCGFKAIQFMALEIPVLVSPVGVNQEIVSHNEDGFHCCTENDWESYLEQLICSAELRVAMGEKGREKIVKHYSVESQRVRFFSLFDCEDKIAKPISKNGMQGTLYLDNVPKL